jgi:spore coat polysaccharide biosynthesis protein SpsF
MTKGKISIIIQARVDSKRLPNKILKEIIGKPMILHIINRLKKIKNIDQIILATTNKKEDDVIADIAKKNNIFIFRGDDNDVLKRFYDCAIHFEADPIIRITADCPLIDPSLVNEILNFYLNNNYDYVSNTIHPTYPDGLDTEIFSFSSLKNATKNATLPSEREHVTPYIKKHQTIFKSFNFQSTDDLSHIRLTVDEKEDLKLIRQIYSILNSKVDFTLNDVLNLIQKKPELLQINSKFKRNEGYLESLSKDI